MKFVRYIREPATGKIVFEEYVEAENIVAATELPGWPVDAQTRLAMDAQVGLPMYKSTAGDAVRYTQQPAAGEAVELVLPSEYLSSTYREERAALYPGITDQLDAIVKALASLQAGKGVGPEAEQLISACQRVKSAFPKVLPSA